MALTLQDDHIWFIWYNRNIEICFCQSSVETLDEQQQPLWENFEKHPSLLLIAFHMLLFAQSRNCSRKYHGHYVTKETKHITLSCSWTSYLYVSLCCFIFWLFFFSLFHFCRLLISWRWVQAKLWGFERNRMEYLLPQRPKMKAAEYGDIFCFFFFSDDWHPHKRR